MPEESVAPAQAGEAGINIRSQPGPTSTGEPNLADRLARAITLAGPMPVARYMAAANADYYARAPSVGAAGDFITAPEVSQMFGELIGAWVADLVHRSDSGEFAYVELGPGRGTLAADALRVLAKAGLRPPVHFVETSPRLRAEQAHMVEATWHDDLTTLPDDRPLVIVANEFFDALPVEQVVRTPAGWARRMVACQYNLFVPIAGAVVPDMIVPEHLRDAPVGSIVESSPAGVGIVRAIAERLTAQGGAALIVDYGYDGPALGDTLQAVRGHGYANPFEAPGQVDLSAHVDFAVLGAAAGRAGLKVHGPVAQRDFLGQLGIAQRVAALARQSPERADAIAAAHQRLTGAQAMGTLFRAASFAADGWPTPAGFA